MPLDVVKLQKIVDKMSTPGKNGWSLNHDYAPAFFELVSPYIKRAAYKSEYNHHGDPEDAFAETRWEVWRALEKYGPRPKGNLFGDYTLKLKTNNVLTNREKKRSSYKSCLNFVSESLDGLEALEAAGSGRHYGQPFCLPFDVCILKEELHSRSKKGNKKRRKIKVKKFIYKEDPVEVHIFTTDPVERHISLINDPVEQHILVEDLVERHVLFEKDPVEQHISLINDPVECHISLINDPVECHISLINDPVEKHICENRYKNNGKGTFYRLI